MVPLTRGKDVSAELNPYLYKFSSSDNLKTSIKIKPLIGDFNRIIAESGLTRVSKLSKLPKN